MDARTSPGGEIGAWLGPRRRSSKDPAGFAAASTPIVVVNRLRTRVKGTSDTGADRVLLVWIAENDAKSTGDHTSMITLVEVRSEAKPSGAPPTPIARHLFGRGRRRRWTGHAPGISRQVTVSPFDAGRPGPEQIAVGQKLGSCCSMNS